MENAKMEPPDEENRESKESNKPIKKLNLKNEQAYEKNNSLDFIKDH